MCKLCSDTLSALLLTLLVNAVLTLSTNVIVVTKLPLASYSLISKSKNEPACRLECPKDPIPFPPERKQVRAEIASILKHFHSPLPSLWPPGQIAGLSLPF